MLNQCGLAVIIITSDTHVVGLTSQILTVILGRIKFNVGKQFPVEMRYCIADDVHRGFKLAVFMICAWKKSIQGRAGHIYSDFAELNSYL